MQESTTRSFGQNIAQGAAKSGQPHRNIRPQGTDIAQVVPDYTFLSETIESKWLIDFLHHDSMLSFDLYANLNTLMACARRYLSLYDIDFSFNMVGVWSEDFINLANSFSKLLPCGQQLDISLTDNGFVFSVYTISEKAWSSFLFIPINIVETFNSDLQKIFLEFIALMMDVNNLPYISETLEYEVIEQDIEDYFDDMDDVSKMQNIADMYNEGAAYRLFRQILSFRGNVSTDIVRNDIMNYVCKSQVERKQVECMLRGILLMEECSLSQYCFPVFDDEILEDIYDGDFGSWKETILFHYGGKDDKLIELIYRMKSDYYDNSDFIEPSTGQVLSEGGSLYKLPDADYPFRWFDYIVNDFMENLTID